MLPRAARGVRDARADLLRLRLLLVVLVELARARRRYAEQMIERLGLDGVEPRRRDRLQRRLPAAVLPRAPDPRARHRAGRQRRRGRASQKGIPTLVEFFGVETARSLARRVRGRPAARQQRARPRARPQRLRRRHEGPAQARRRDHDGVPAPDAPDRGEPVGHDLPRALLLLLLPRPSRACSRRTACACSTSRSCPTHGGSLRIYGCHADDAPSPRRDARARAARARARRRLRAARHLPRLRPARRARTSARSCAS